MAHLVAKKQSPIDEIEWAGTGENPEEWIHDDGLYALETRDAPLLGRYLREAAIPHLDIIKALADFLDPPSNEPVGCGVVSSLPQPPGSQRS